MREWIVRQFLEVGRYLFEAGLVDRFSGNLSVKWKGKIYITRSGSPLPNLKPCDILEIKEGKPLVGKPSSEFVVHKRIYELTDHLAVAHAHPPTVVKLAFSLNGDFYEPTDNEGKLLLGRVPVLRLKRPSASPELAEAVAKALKVNPCAIVYSHGVFCASNRLLDAAGLVSALEFSAKVAL